MTRDNVIPIERPAALTGGGTNQVRVGAYNERLVLSLVRYRGAMSKAEIARQSGLSVQTASVIVRSLEESELLLRGEPQRGGVGQPSVPMRLNPRGAFSMGLKIGRRSADIVLIDFVGRVLDRASLSFDYPRPIEIMEFAVATISMMRARLDAGEEVRIAGLGIALPFELWDWAERIGAPVADMATWRSTTIFSDIAEATGLSVHPINDATSACGSELMFGLGRELSDFVYLYVGTFAGGGIVLDNALFRGRRGNAGALGSLPNPNFGRSGSSGDRELLQGASMLELEKRLHLGGHPLSAIWQNTNETGVKGSNELSEIVSRWVRQAARPLAQAAISCCAIMDIDTVIIDGAFPSPIRNQVVKAVDDAIDGTPLRGMARPDPRSGTIGSDARAIGGAGQPLASRYMVDRDMLFSSGTSSSK